MAKEINMVLQEDMPHQGVTAVIKEDIAIIKEATAIIREAMAIIREATEIIKEIDMAAEMQPTVVEMNTVGHIFGL
jgi:hypothetical protein